LGHRLFVQLTIWKIERWLAGALAGYCREDAMASLLINDENNDDKRLSFAEPAPTMASVAPQIPALEGWPEGYNRKSVLGKGHDGICYLCDDGKKVEQVDA
jgi:hypothetical protein